MYYNNTTLLNGSDNRFIDKLQAKIVFAIIMGCLCFITTIGNICVIYRFRKASFVGNLFIISLACADLIVGCFVMPLATVYAITEIWTMTLPICQIWLGADYTASTASILNLLTLSLDRYWSITSPLRYLGKRTKTRALIMIGLAWSVSLLWLFPIIGWPYVFNDGVRTVTPNKCDTEYHKNVIFKVLTAIFNFYLPLIAMILINLKCYLVIRKRYRNPIMKYVSTTTTINQLKKSSKPTYLAASPGSVISLASKFEQNIKKTNNLQFNSISNSTTFSFKLSKSKSKSQCCIYGLLMLLNCKYFETKKKQNTLTPEKLTKKFEEAKTSKLQRFNKTSSLKRQDTYRSVATRFRRSFEISNSVQMARFINRDNQMVPSKSENLVVDFETGIESPIFLNNKTSDTNINEKFVFDEITRHSVAESKQDKINSTSNNNNNNNINNKPIYFSLTKDKINFFNEPNEKAINRKGFMNKQEKAFKQLSAIVFGFTLCFLPYFIVFMIVAICEECISESVFTVTVWLGYLNSTINPWIYALSNKRRFLKPFSKKKNTNHNINKSFKTNDIAAEKKEIKLSNFSLSNLFKT